MEEAGAEEKHGLQTKQGDCVLFSLPPKWKRKKWGERLMKVSAGRNLRGPFSFSSHNRSINQSNQTQRDARILKAEGNFLQMEKIGGAEEKLDKKL